MQQVRSGQFQEGRTMIRRRTTFRIAAAAATVLLAGALAACSGGGGGGGNSAGANSPIVACGDQALSGVYAQIGESDNWGAEAYFKHVNATGGILGHQVKYINLNNQSNAAQSELNAKKCIQTYHAQFIIGPESGADTESALPIAIANKTILISLSSGWQTNGYPASELNSYGFPGFYDVFAAGPDRLGAEPDRAAGTTPGSRCSRTTAARSAWPTRPPCRAWPRRTASSSSPPRSTRSAPPTSPRRCSPCWPPSRRSSSSAWCQAPTRSRPSRPSGRRTRPSRSASAPGCEIPSFVSAAGGPTAMQNIYVLGSMRNWLTQAQAGSTARATRRPRPA